eukprot:s3258_g8.t1
MRARWRLRFGADVEDANEEDPNEMSSALPVSFPEELDDDFPACFEDVDKAFCGGEDFEVPASLRSWDKLPSDDEGASVFPPVPPLAQAIDPEADGHVRFVDKGSVPTSSKPSTFERVASAAPPVIVSEALRLTDKKPLLFPWEKGRLGRIFGDQGRLSMKLPQLSSGSNSFVQVGIGITDNFCTDGTVSVEHPPDDSAIYMGVLKSIVGCSYDEERVAQRDHCLKQWWDLLRLNLSASDPGRVAVKEHGLADMYKYGMETLDAIFGLKSPNTLLKRLCAIKLFNRWLIMEYSETWIPFDEQRVWAYMRHLRESKAPASRAVSLLESIRFCHFTMKIDGAQSVLESLRVKGLASQLYANKKPWRPSDVLSFSDVEFLHHCFMDRTRSDVDRIIVGHFLHLLYARARFSDLFSVTDCFLDDEGAFLEVSATLHKGAKSMDSKSRLLPIVAPAQGICGDNWAKVYLQLRHQAGLSEPGKESGPMLLAPNRGGLGWSDRYITSHRSLTISEAAFHG